MIKIGLVGLPNVGKSSLFRFLTRKEVLIANYPFATIDPNRGLMPIPDSRLEKLGKSLASRKITPSFLQWIDIAGLLKGAAKGCGLGNEFLAHIREVDLICQVVRCFVDPQVEHVEKTVDPLRDYQIIQSELILADLQGIAQRKTKKQSKKTLFFSEKEEKALAYWEENLNKGSILQERKDLLALIQNYSLLTAKPQILVANYGQLTEIISLKNYTEKKQIPFFALAIQAENNCLNLSFEEKKKLGITSLADLQSFTEQIKNSLNLKVFFTAGPQETKSWLAPREMKARECAGLIHSDLERGFIRAQVYHYQDWLACPNEQQLKKAGKIRSESAQYLVKDGDICHFLFNV